MCTAQGIFEAHTGEPRLCIYNTHAHTYTHSKSRTRDAYNVQYANIRTLGELFRSNNIGG